MHHPNESAVPRPIACGRRELNKWLLAAIPSVLSLMGARAFGQGINLERPITIIVTYGPGGPNDILGRYIANKLSPRLARPTIVENRSGGGGTIGLRAVTNMVADGNTIVVLSSGHAIEQAFRKDAGYDLLKDFKLIASLAAMSQVLVSRSDFRFQTTQQLLAYLRTSPGKVSCATASPPQLEYLRAIAGVDLTIVPYRGANKSVQDVLGGHIDLAFPPLPEVASHLQSGTLRGLGISSLARVAAFPDIPTLAEAVPGFHLEGWYGLAVAARTPLEIVERLRHELSAITEAPDFAEFLEKRNYAPPIPLSEFPAIVANEVRRFQKLIIDQKLPQYE